MRALNLITLLLVIVGGINWLFVGIADVDLVAALFGRDSALSTIVYILVGFSIGETAAEANASRFD
jgi:uncharacterized membrane protein YuzA (DUF378 family)